MGVKTALQVMEDLEDPPERVMAIKSSALPSCAGCPDHRQEKLCLAENTGTWQEVTRDLLGAKRESRMKPVFLIKLLAQENET